MVALGNCLGNFFCKNFIGQQKGFQGTAPGLVEQGGWSFACTAKIIQPQPLTTNVLNTVT